MYYVVHVLYVYKCNTCTYILDHGLDAIKAEITATKHSLAGKLITGSVALIALMPQQFDHHTTNVAR